MKKKIKQLGIGAMSGVMIGGSLLSPMTAIAAEDNQLVEADMKNADDYGFYYKKNKEGIGNEGSFYILSLEKGLKKTGEEFDLNKDQKQEGSIMLKSSKDIENRVQVSYDGLYQLRNIQRDPGLFLHEGLDGSNDNLMHKKDEYFEFPSENSGVEQKVAIKESEFLSELEVILRSDRNRGLKGEFKLSKVADPASVYGILTESELKDLIGDTSKSIDGYNAPENEEDKNTVKDWNWFDEEVERATIEINKETKINWDAVENTEDTIEYANNAGEIEEGIYKLQQTESTVGYNLRSDVYFVVTLDSNNEPALHFIDDIDSKKMVDEFNKKNKLEYFVNSTLKDKVDSLYQALLVNYTIPGMWPNPDNPYDPDDPDVEPSFHKSVNRTEEVKLQDLGNDIYDIDEGDDESDDDGYYLDDYGYGDIPGMFYLTDNRFDEDVGYENTLGDDIKVNVGEKFSLNFGFSVPKNIKEYDYLTFVDILDDAIVLPEDFNQDNIKIYTREFEYNTVYNTVDPKGLEEIDVLKELKFSNEEGKKYVEMDFDIDKLADIFGKDVDDIHNGDIYADSIYIQIDGVYLREGTREDVKNRGYLYYKEGDNETPTPENPWERPEDKDVIDPDDPDKPLDPSSPNKPTIPTTPEVTIDPITVDFRMGVVDSGTTILNNAEYEIISFTPSRGSGGIDDNGDIYVGDVTFNINEMIDAGEGFVKLQDLPAGQYKMVETVAPVKGDDKYRLVTQTLEFRVHENEKDITIIQPIVKNGSEIGEKQVVDAQELYREDDGITRNEENWNHGEVHNGEAMLHHYRFINTPETGTLAQIPFFIGGGAAVSAGIYVRMRKKEE